MIQPDSFLEPSFIEDSVTEADSLYIESLHRIKPTMVEFDDTEFVTLRHQALSSDGADDFLFRV